MWARPGLLMLLLLLPSITYLYFWHCLCVWFRLEQAATYLHLAANRGKLRAQTASSSSSSSGNGNGSSSSGRHSQWRFWVEKMMIILIKRSPICTRLLLPLPTRSPLLNGSSKPPNSHRWHHRITDIWLTASSRPLISSDQQQLKLHPICA